MQAIVEDGVIWLPGNVRLPDQTMVYVVVPGLRVERVGRVASPRLAARWEQTADFVMDISEIEGGVGV